MLLKVLQMISPQDYYNKNQVTNFNVLVAYLWGCRPSLFCSSEKCFMFIHHPSSTCKEKKCPPVLICCCSNTPINVSFCSAIEYF